MDPMQQGDSLDLSMNQLRGLKRQGIEDPDIDLLLTVDRNAPDGVQNALGREHMSTLL
jgi:hypothetical protein